MSEKPSFMCEKPNPTVKQRLFNGRKILVWEGQVKIAAIEGWVENPRIEIARKRVMHAAGDRALQQSEVFDLMKNDKDVKLRELSDDIVKNGLREPLTLSFKGKLLDGNRRFFAIKLALETLPPSDPNRQDLETVSVYVLDASATQEDEENVLVEENFSASLKIEWPDYVKARRVVSAADEGLTEKDLVKKFDWPRSKVRETLRVHEITTEFLAFATNRIDPDDENGGGLGMSEEEAESVVARQYQYFNEAQKSFFEPLKSDFDFKLQFFRWINEGKFSSFPEVRVAYKAWNNLAARSVLQQPDPGAAKSAKAMIDYSERVVKGKDEIVVRIDGFTKFLNEITVLEMSSLPTETKKALERALELVIKMSRTAEESA